MWGFGGLTFGLTMRYLGMSLGMGVALGYCAAFGTLLPPIFKTFIPDIPVPETIAQIAATTPGQVTLAGRGGLPAGHRDRRAGRADQGTGDARGGEEEGHRRVQLHQGHPGGHLLRHHERLLRVRPDGGQSDRRSLARRPAPRPLWTGLPKLVVVLLGGFTTNFIWCVLLNIKNRTGYQYFASARPARACRPERRRGGEHGAGGAAGAGRLAGRSARCRMLGNYFFSALAGTTWYFQFFFYTMGETQMGKFGFASWTLHMASIIIFSTMWGWIFHEWKGSSKKAHTLIAGGIATLILSTIVIGFGTWLKSQAAGGH